MKAGPTLVGALVILVSMPIALFVFQGMWRSRMEQELPPARVVRSAAPAPAAIVAPPEEAPAAPKVPLRPVDELLLGVFAGENVPAGKDVMPDGPKVTLIGTQDGHGARVDLDRDGKWDEVWSIRADEVLRYVSPRDDGDMSERYSWTNGEWVPITAGPPAPSEMP